MAFYSCGSIWSDIVLVSGSLDGHKLEIQIIDPAVIARIVTRRVGILSER